MMNIYKAIHIGAAMMVLAGCTTPGAEGIGLPGQRIFQDAQDGRAGWRHRLAYLNPKFTPANYNAVLLEPVVYYPEPRPTENVSMQTLEQIRSYADTSMRQKNRGVGTASRIGRAPASCASPCRR